MNMMHPIASEQRSASFLGWLGFGKRSGPEAAATHAMPDHRWDPRSRLLGEIAEFLLDNGLEISQSNLCTAHAAFAGLNPGLKRKIAKRLASGEAITQAWLDLATAAEGDSGDASVDELVGKLERGIDDFSRSTRTARSTTTLYGDALEKHVDELEAAPDPDKVITSLADYARAMLARSRKAEEELRSSESEAASLRRHLDRARRDAEVDYLTGLPNRRAFEALLEKEYREAQAALDPLCVAFCDIDHFKAVNDTHGHEAGDRVIKVVADTLAHISDRNCHIARHGGEEFVLLFRGMKPHEAFEKLDAARAELAERKLINRKTEQPFGQITFSGGVADVFAYDDPRTALAAADEALYCAKESGRNQIRQAGIR